MPHTSSQSEVSEEAMDYPISSKFRLPTRFSSRRGVRLSRASRNLVTVQGLYMRGEASWPSTPITPRIQALVRLLVPHELSERLSREGSLVGTRIQCESYLFLPIAKDSNAVFGEGASLSRDEEVVRKHFFEEDREGFLGRVGVRSSCEKLGGKLVLTFSVTLILFFHFSGLALPFLSPSAPDFPSSIIQSQFPMENRSTCSNQLPESFNPIKSKPNLPSEVSNLVTISQGDVVVSPSGEFQIEGLSPRKMAKVREVLSSLDIKVYSRRKNRRSTGLKKRRVVKDFLRLENPDIVMIQETKKVECDRRFVGNVWTVRNKEWAALPACRASGGILIIWDSNKLRSEEVVIGSFSVSVKFSLDGCGPLWLSAVYGQTSLP
ncbi:hypothetical protein CK203_043955 [Vitis vinifera]|uniref:Endonuclease/exonuclease/phosphatase domain-containing protein n=1 Tax=Vitis vinifera TaxID=29760 RepID=A0A438HTI7_VITVI|nr:hypothetical protein CK203_043955 [Vitis vinifera]